VGKRQDDSYGWTIKLGRRRDKWCGIVDGLHRADITCRGFKGALSPENSSRITVSNFMSTDIPYARCATDGRFDYRLMVPS